MRKNRKKLKEFGENIIKGANMIKEARWTFFETNTDITNISGYCGCALGLGLVGTVGDVNRARDLYLKGSGDPVAIISKILGINKADLEEISATHAGGKEAAVIAERLINGLNP